MNSPTRMPRSIEAHQVLLGYKQGHRTLAASIKLPATTEKTLLRLSDAGDVATSPHFPTLLAGFPLIDTSLYALMKTWPAPDIARPGAVWTHALLVRASDLDCVSVNAVLRGFRRPKDNDTEPYSRPTLLEDLEDHTVDADSALASDDIVATILWALYEAPARPVCVVLSDMRSEDRQSLLLAILRQQWPELRATFTFAESPSWERTLGERVFDLQLSSSSGAAAMARRKDQPLRIIRGRPTSGPPRWASRAADGLNSDQRLRDFLREFGQSHGTDRSAYSALAEIFDEVIKSETERMPVDGVLSALKKHFPKRSEGRDLKEALFGRPNTRILRSDDVSVLWTLSLNPAASCISSNDLELSDRAGFMWRHEVDRAQQLVIALTQLGRAPNHLAREVLRGFGRAMSPTDLEELLVREESAGILILETFPEALLTPEFWSGPRSASEKGLHFLVSVSTKPKLLPEILRNMISNADPDLAPQAFSSFPEAITICLQAAADGEENAIAWARHLRPGDLPGVLPSRLTPGLAAVLLEIGDRKTVARIPAADWCAILDSEDGKLELLQRGASILYAAALKQSPPPADRLATQTYSKLYRWAVDGELKDAEVLSILESVMVDAEPWDVGKGMAMALVDAFRKRKSWRIRELLTIDDRDAFRALLRHDAKSHKKSSLAGELVTTLPDTVVLEWQLNVIQETLESYARRDDLVHLLGKLFKAVVKRL